MSSRELHQLLERVTAVLRSDLRELANRRGLKLAQVEALAYLAVANRYSDTPAGLTEYLGVTKGTVSQTLIALENKGLVEKVPDPRDGRLVHCRLTDAGTAIASEAVPAKSLAGLDDRDAAAFGEPLRELLRALQRERGGRTFGECHTCSHFRREGTGFRCGLTTEPLSRVDSTLLCREHALADTGPP